MKHGSNNSVRRGLFVLALAAAFWTAATVNAIDGTPVWFNSTVALHEAGFHQRSPVLAFNHFGTPSVVWSRYSSSGAMNRVMRAERGGLGLWSRLDLAAGSGVGVVTGLSFDRSERPVVAWMNQNEEVVADFNNGQTNSSVGGLADLGAGALSLSHDLAGNLRGMYLTRSNDVIRSISYDGAAFSSAPMLTMPGFSQLMDAQLTTDHLGLRHVVARGELESSIHQGVVIASEPSFPGAWPTATLAIAPDVYGISIATNPLSGHVAIAYTTHDAGANLAKLVYAEFNGIEIETTEVLSSATSRFEDISMAFDRTDGRPAIAYEENVFGGPDRLQLAYLASTQWETSLIDDSVWHDNAVGNLRPSLAFDDYGTSYPAVAYIDGNGDLTVAFDPPAAPEPATAALLLASAAVLVRRRR